MGQSNYGSSRWRRVRKRHLRLHPTCQHEGGCNEPATVVHHRDGLGLAGPQAYRAANLQALCKSHHDQHTAAEQPGGWNRKPRRRAEPTHPGLIGG